MGDTTFASAASSDSYENLITSDALLSPLEESSTLSAPMCTDCAFEPYCGADPVYHHATSGDYVGRKPNSAFCQRSMAISRLLLELYEGDEFARDLFQQWAFR